MEWYGVLRKVKVKAKYIDRKRYEIGVEVINTEIVRDTALAGGHSGVYYLPLGG